MSYILKGKLESVKRKFADETQEITIVPVGEYTLKIGKKKFFVVPDVDNTDAKLFEYDESLSMKLPDTVKVDNFFTGKIISLTVEEVNHGTPDATIEVENPESIEFFA